MVSYGKKMIYIDDVEMIKPGQHMGTT